MSPPDTASGTDAPTTAAAPSVDSGPQRRVDVAALERALADAISGEVRFDTQAKALYSTDASNYRRVPIGVVTPASIDDVVAAVKVCREFDVPITCRGGGTSLAGQCCNVGVVIDFSRHLNRIVELDPARRCAWVEPGCVLDDLRNAAEEHHLTFGPDPSTHNHNTLGGMIGNNSCGVHALYAGRTADNVEALDILTYDGVRMTVGATDDAEFARLAAEDGRRGEIYRSLAALRDTEARNIRARYPQIPRRISGYNLDELLPERGFNVARALVGSEGTCVVVLGARLRLVESPPKRALAVLGYRNVYDAADAVPVVRAHAPIGLEGLDEKLVEFMKVKGLHPEDVELLPEGEGWLLVEFGAESEDAAREKAHKLIDDLGLERDWAKVYGEGWQATKIWEVRKAGLAATAHVPNMPETHPGWEDAAVPPDRVGAYLRDFRKLLDRFGYDCSLYGHFGDGCIHCRIDFDFKSLSGVGDYLHFIEEAADLVMSYGGSLSGEHGDGQSRAALLERMYGPELVAAFRAFKGIWDPRGRMNPGKIVEPRQPDDDLRQGPDFRPFVPDTQFSFPEDGGNFIAAAARCVGVGECRRHDSGVMCPSYRATYEEAYSTRGRARMLFEMMRGDLVHDRWRSEAVKDSLEYCLACKACKTECPVNVDMATYKAEFMHQHYKGRLCPRDQYAMGLIWWWARAASHAPRLANAAFHAPGLARLAKWAGGIAAQREIPPFADTPFRRWFDDAELMAPGTGGRRHHERGGAMSHAELLRHGQSTYAAPSTTGHRALRGGLNPMGQVRARKPETVLLWPDTFNGYFTPGPLQAAAHVLSEAGFEVRIPQRPLCCGRPLYAPGMLSLARRLWRRNLAALEPYIRADMPIVAVEPACAASFRDELPNLFPKDEDAKRLSRQVHLLSEFLEMEDYVPPRLDGRAVVHGHCHHRAVLQMDAEISVLKKTGLEVRMLDETCCGMAGDFGFRAKTYDVSIGVAELGFLPALRDTPDDVHFVANGYSCREQGRQAGCRTPLTLAELLYEGLRHRATPA